MPFPSPPVPGLVVGVLGASGGLGASTLAVALAVVAARDAAHRGLAPAAVPAAVPAVVPAVVVDGAVAGGGLDVTACVEHLPGLRWGDLAGARGEVSGPDLARDLPLAGGAAVLSAVPGGPPAPPEVVTSVVAALRATTDLVVVDLPRTDGAPSLVVDCDVVLLLAGGSPRHLSDAAAARAALAAADSAPGDVHLVARGGAAGSELAVALADHLDLPLAARWRDDGRVVRDAERGQTPGTSRRSSLAALCGDLLDDLLLGRGGSLGEPLGASLGGSGGGSRAQRGAA